jgi:hypothetical protein
LYDANHCHRNPTASATTYTAETPQKQQSCQHMRYRGLDTYSVYFMTFEAAAYASGMMAQCTHHHGRLLDGAMAGLSKTQQGPAGESAAAAAGC